MPTAQQLSRATSARATRDSEGTPLPPFLAQRRVHRGGRRAPPVAASPRPNVLGSPALGEKATTRLISPLLAPATRSREAAMVAASPAEGAMTVRKGMISRLECENFKCVPDTSRVAPIRASLPRCALAFPHLERARQIPQRGRPRPPSRLLIPRELFLTGFPAPAPCSLATGRTRATR